MRTRLLLAALATSLLAGAARAEILIPLSDNLPFEQLVDRASSVKFDFTAGGMPTAPGWITPAAGWLVWDPEDHADIDSGALMFGAHALFDTWASGYAALARFDSDGDGQLTRRELNGFAVWRDTNGDGVSQPEEVQPISALGIVALRFAPQRLTDDVQTAPAGVSFSNGRNRPTYDWTPKR